MSSRNISPSVITIAVDFPPQPGFIRRLSEISERICEKLKLKEWAIQAQRSSLFREDNMVVYTIDHRSMNVRIKDEGCLAEGAQGCFDAIKFTVEAYELSKVDNLSVVHESLVDIGMSHQEMSDLGRTNYLNNPDSVLDGTNDWQVSFISNIDTTSTRVEVSPMTPSDALKQYQQLISIGGVNDAIWEIGLANIAATITQDRLFVRYIKINKEASKHDIPRLISKSLEEAKSSTNTAIDRLMALR